MHHTHVTFSLNSVSQQVTATKSPSIYKYFCKVLLQWFFTICFIKPWHCELLLFPCSAACEALHCLLLVCRAEGEGSGLPGGGRLGRSSPQGPFCSWQGCCMLPEGMLTLPTHSGALQCPRPCKRSGCNQHTYKGRPEGTCCWSLIQTNMGCSKSQSWSHWTVPCFWGILSLKRTKQELKSQRIWSSSYPTLTQ